MTLMNTGLLLENSSPSPGAHLESINEPYKTDEHRMGNEEERQLMINQQQKQQSIIQLE